MNTLTLQKAIMFTIGTMKAKHKLEITADEAIDLTVLIEKNFMEAEESQKVQEPVIKELQPVKIIQLNK